MAIRRNLSQPLAASAFDGPDKPKKKKVSKKGTKLSKADYEKAMKFKKQAKDAIGAGDLLHQSGRTKPGKEEKIFDKQKDPSVYYAKQGKEGVKKYKKVLDEKIKRGKAKEWDVRKGRILKKDKIKKEREALREIRSYKRKDYKYAK
tara:strand:- start:233 stop:673 length:441 start_codon:yes stop_codon:yes gene_type:complete